MRFLVVFAIVTSLAQLPRTHAAPEALTPPAPNPASAGAATGRGAAIVAALDLEDIDTAARLAREAAAAGDADGQFLFGFLHDLGLGVELSFEEGAVWQDKAAQQGHFWARLYLAWKWRTGMGVKEADPGRAQELQGDLFQREPPPRLLATGWLGVNGRNFVPRFPRAADWLRRRAEGGDGLAGYNFAQYLLYGLAGRPDPHAHLEWLRRAAGLGYANAAARLDMYYGTGLFVTEDKTEAAQWERRAAELGHAPSQHALGRASERAGDLAGARHWLGRAAAQDHIHSLNRLADLLRKSGPGDRTADLSEALRLSKRAAELGSAEALADVAGMYRSGDAVAKDPAKAFALYRQAAETGYAYAAMMTGWMLAHGEVGPSDFVAAREWYEKAAAGDNASAMSELGLLYLNGRGVEKDPARAFLWIERAAREGHARSQNRLGMMLRDGTGVEKDDEEAVHWFKLAAEAGETAAHANLGYHYVSGRGVPKDLLLAFDHLAAALRTENDAGSRQNFLGLFLAATPGERPALHTRLKKLLDDPATLAATGLLPEVCVELALRVFSADEPKYFLAILRRYQQSGRASVAPLMAHLSFYGVGGPHDLAEARRWARATLAGDAGRGRFLEAVIESVAADDPAERERHQQTLVQLAREGNAEARGVLEMREQSVYSPAELREKIPGADHLAALERALGPRGPDAPPAPLFTLPPKYPRELWAAGREGEVTMEFKVSPEGAVQEIRVVSASHPLFIAPVSSALTHWRFAPGLREGRKISSRIRQSFPFRLPKS